MCFMMEEDNKVFETLNLLVFHNGSGEIFVRNKETGVQIRIHETSEGLSMTSGNGNGRFEPWSVNGLPAIRVRKQ